MTTREFIKYRSHYKYQLAETYELRVELLPRAAIETEFIKLSCDGMLVIKRGYAWDGPPAPIEDVKSNIRASLVVDALYQLMRNEELTTRTYRKAANLEFKRICREDGASVSQAARWYKRLRSFGKPLASPENKGRIHRSLQEGKGPGGG